MLKIFDKAQWQIDGGIPEELVVNYFNLVFLWLDKHELLSDEGKEEFDEGIDCEASLNEEQLTNEGVDFLDKYYDKFLMAIAKEKYGKENSIAELDKLYKEYKNN